MSLRPNQLEYDSRCDAQFPPAVCHLLPVLLRWVRILRMVCWTKHWCLGATRELVFFRVTPSFPPHSLTTRARAVRVLNPDVEQVHFLPLLEYLTKALQGHGGAVPYPTSLNGTGCQCPWCPSKHLTKYSHAPDCDIISLSFEFTFVGLC
jgi:hypothetical protein